MYEDETLRNANEDQQVMMPKFDEDDFQQMPSPRNDDWDDDDDDWDDWDDDDDD